MRHLFAIIICLAICSPSRPDALAKLSRGLLEKPAAKVGALIVEKNPRRPGGLSFRRAELTPAQAMKAAAADRVVAVLPDKPLKVPPVPGPHLTWESMHFAGPIRPDTWFAKDIHGAALAWKSGYTGAGVKVAVIDEGIDFGHPDLEGCQARVTNPSSPYYGWPIVFDPFSMYYFAKSGGLKGAGGYVSTSLTITEANPKFRGETYVLPGTSKSGIYHIGIHPSYWMQFIIGAWGQPPAVLVADEREAGVYDTVYVDLNKDHDFRNDKPCRKGDEASWWDADGDGLADYSGGMIYFIADGRNPVPASDWMYGTPAPPNGSIVCFAGSFGKYDAHGTLAASAIAAQGKVGRTYRLPQKPEPGGMVYGMAPGAGIIQIGNIYSSQANLYDALQFAVAGYDGVPGTGDEADIVNMSFGISEIDNDGWDFLCRYITYLNETVASKTTFVAASGNGGPGYGTVNSPGGASGIVTAGAATLAGSTDLLLPVSQPEQIQFGDVQQWSDRGPSSLGQVKPDVTAIGAYATGDVPIYGSGEYAWALWGGTSLSAPITSGILALIYEAYRTRHGVFPDHDIARAILMAGARDLGYNVFEQGAGLVDASRSTSIAAGKEGVVVRPSSWAVGGYMGTDASAFAHVLYPGGRQTKEFTVENVGARAVRVDVSAKRLQRIGGTSFEIQTRGAAEDAEAVWEKPDYLVDITRAIRGKPDLLRIRVTVPYQSFSLSNPADARLQPASLWMASLYDWTDLNGDGSLWADLNGNGAVNDGEFQVGEINPFMFGSPWCDVIELSARDPARRMHDGLFLGLTHILKNEHFVSIRLRVELEFYRQVDWKWLRVSERPIFLRPGEKAMLSVTAAVPRDAAPGFYAGALQITPTNHPVWREENKDSRKQVTVPISIAVATPQTDVFPVSVAGSDCTGDSFDNGRMFGAFDWGWREESGDWRFYFMDVPELPQGAKSYILANARWKGMPADTDIIFCRPDWTDYFSTAMPDLFGPHGLVISGSSRRTHSTAGMWPFDTATGGPSEWAVGEAAAGLNQVQLHNVLFPGRRGAEAFAFRAGRVSVWPDVLHIAAGEISAKFMFTSMMRLKGLSSLAFGLSTPEVIAGIPAPKDPPFEPQLAGWKKELIVSGGAGMIEVSTNSSYAIDIDLYLLYDANGDGYFDWDYELLAVSGTPSANEHIRYLLPKDGRYLAAVHGYSVPSPAKFDIRIYVPSRRDISVLPPEGTIERNHSYDIDLAFPPAQPGALGIVFLGPPEAPGVIPIEIRVENGQTE